MTTTSFQNAVHPQDRLIIDLETRRAGMIAYLKLKISEEDWHGTADAAMDLREIDAKLQLLKDGK